MIGDYSAMGLEPCIEIGADRVRYDGGNISWWLIEQPLVALDYRWDRKVRYYDGRVEDFVILVHRH